MQNVAKVADAVYEVLASLAIVMKVNLDISDAIANHFRQGFNQRRVIFLLRIEKRVLRRASDGIALTAPRNRRPFRPPQSDARSRSPHARALPQWFVMIRHEYPYVLKLHRPRNSAQS